VGSGTSVKRKKKGGREEGGDLVDSLSRNQSHGGEGGGEAKAPYEAGHSDRVGYTTTAGRGGIKGKKTQLLIRGKKNRGS